METLPFGVTASGNTLVAELNNVVFAGSGLEGTLTVDTTQPPGSTGEAVLATVHPDGSESITVFETCNPCSFQGRTGSTTLRAYGTISATGLATGTFLVASSGAGNGDLSTLAGYGTFSSDGQPLGTLGHRLPPGDHRTADAGTGSRPESTGALGSVPLRTIPAVSL